MKNALSTAALIATLALSAWNAQAQVPSAEAGNVMDLHSTHSALSRQQVKNEFLAARANGTLKHAGGDGYLIALPTNTRQAATQRSQIERQASTALQAADGLPEVGTQQ